MMPYEVWAIETGNRIAALATEAEALSLICDLIRNGWIPDDLALLQNAGNTAELAILDSMA